MIRTTISHIEREIIHKSVSIRSPKEKVWEVLTVAHYNRIWYQEFSPGASVISDWQLGSRVQINDGTGSGLVARVTEAEPASRLSMEYIGFLEEGREDLNSEDAINVKGYTEAYKLEERNGLTILTVEQQTSREHLPLFETMWDKALRKIKYLSEENPLLKF